MNNESLNVRPHKVNAGGIFISALKGALQPIACFFLVPVTLLIPSLSAFYLYQVFTRQNDRILGIKPGFLKGFNLRTVIYTEFFYVITLVVTLYFIVQKWSLYLHEYLEKASKNKAIQIGTPEQFTYSHQVNYLLGLLGFVVILLLFFVFAYTFLQSKLKEENQKANDINKLVIKAFTMNLHLTALYGFALIFIFAVIETYFARFKLMHLAAYVLNKDSFNPNIPFLLLRLYVLHIAIYTLGLFTYTAVGLRNKIKLKPENLQPDKFFLFLYNPLML